METLCMSTAPMCTETPIYGLKYLIYAKMTLIQHILLATCQKVNVCNSFEP